MFAPKCSISKLFLRKVFLKFMFPLGFSLTYCCTITRRAPVQKSDFPLMGSKRLKLPWLVTCGIMPIFVLDGCILMPLLLFLPNPIICTSLRFSRLPRDMFQSNMSSFFNSGTYLVGVNECIFQMCSYYRELFRPYTYNQQWDMFHPSTVGVSRLIYHQLFRGIFPKQSGNYWCWW